VPFTLHKPLLEQLQTLSGVSVPSVITAEDGTVFRENLLFTHRGLSGPAVLQISSYWQPGSLSRLTCFPIAIWTRSSTSSVPRTRIKA
jgi:predicted flavoprotein YhiN